MKKNLADSILEKIHAKKIKPHERAYFMAKTILKILLGIAFLAFGMLSVALVWHLIHNFAFAEFILDRPRILFQLIWFGVPLFWLFLSVALWIVTEQVFKQTKRLYRVPFWAIGLSVLCVQIAGGYFLEQSAIGERVDAMFEKQVDWYQGAQRMNERLEKMTEEGFLVGIVVERQSDKLILLNDREQKEWTVHLEPKPDRRQPPPIQKGMFIRMVGEQLNKDEFLAISWRPVQRAKPGSPMMKPRRFQ